MSNFKQILEVEKKYNHLINNSTRKINLKKEKFLSDLKLKEEVIKEDYKKELFLDLQREIKSLEKEKLRLLQEADGQVAKIKSNADVSRVINFLMEEIKNV